MKVCSKTKTKEINPNLRLIFRKAAADNKVCQMKMQTRNTKLLMQIRSKRKAKRLKIDHRTDTQVTLKKVRYRKIMNQFSSRKARIMPKSIQVNSTWS